MENKILVTFASRYGSTREVAGVVAETLRETGLNVDLQPAQQVRSLDGYRAVVLGTAIYYGFLHKDAARFLAAHTAEFGQVPLAIFALGPNSSDEDEMQGSMQQLNEQLVKIPLLKPAVTAVFGGRFPAKLRFPDSLVAVLPASPMHNLPAADARDWDAIHRWAGALAQQFNESLPVKMEEA